MEEALKAENEKLILQLRVTEDEFAIQKLLYEQKALNLQQTIILNHIHNANDTEALLFVDLMDDNTQHILKQECEKWKSFRSDFALQKEALCKEKQSMQQMQQNNEDNLIIIAELNHQNHQYKTQLLECNTSIVTLQNESQLQEMQKVHLSEQNTALKHTISDMEQMNESFKSSLNQKQIEYDALSSEYNTLQGELNEQRYAQQTTHSKLMQCERELSDVRLMKNELQNQMDSSHKSMHSLQLDIENKMALHKEIVFEYKQKMNALTQANANKNNALMQMKQHTQSQLQSWNETKQLMAKQQKEISKELSKIQTQYDGLKRECAQMQGKQHELSTKYLDKCKGFDELSTRYKDDEDAIQRMKAEMDELHDAIMKCNEDDQCKTKENDALATQNHVLNSELNECKENMKTQEQSLHSQSIELQQVRERLEEKVDELKALQSNHESTVCERTKLETMVNDGHERVRVKGKELNELKREYEAHVNRMNDEVNEYKLKYKETAIKCNYLEEQIHDLLLNVEEMKAERLELNDNNEMMREQVTEWKEMQMETEKERNEMEERLKRINAENDELYQEKMMKEDELHELIEKMNHVKVNHEDLVEQNKEMKQEITDLNSKYDLMCNDCDALQERFDAEVKQHGVEQLDMYQNMEFVKQECSAKKKEMERLTEKTNKLQNEMDEKQREYEQYMKSKHQNEFEKESLRKQIVKLEDLVTNLKLEHKGNMNSSELILRALQNNLKQLQNTKQIQLDALKTTQQNLKNANEEMKALKRQHMREMKALNGKLSRVYEDEVQSKGKGKALAKENEALKCELEENEQKMEEDELNIITLSNEIDQLNEKKTTLRLKFDEMEAMYNAMMKSNDKEQLDVKQLTKDHVLCLQNLHRKNEKLSKKIKIQQAKIEMYKKKLSKIKKRNGNKENDASLLNLSSASDILSSASSASSSAGNRINNRKRKYDQIKQGENCSDNIQDHDRRVHKKPRYT